MDVFGAAAAALGVLGEVIDLIDRIRDAVAAQKELPQQLNDYNAEVRQTKEWVRIVRTDRNLEIQSIGPTITMIGNIAEKLRVHLEEMGVDKNPVKQFMHLFMSGAKEKTKLDAIMRHMVNAKIDLIVRVQFELIGINRNIETAVKLSVERIKIVDAKLSARPNIGNYPKLANLLKNHEQVDGIVTMTKEDLEELLKAEGVALQPEKGDRAKKDISDNILGEKSFVVAGPLGEDIWEGADVSIVRNIVEKGGFAILHGQTDLRVLEIMGDTMVKVAEAENLGGRRS